MLRQFGAHLNLIPPDVVQALPFASRQMLLLTMCDANIGFWQSSTILMLEDAKTFISINAAYTRILAWIQGEQT